MNKHKGRTLIKYKFNSDERNDEIVGVGDA